MTVSSYYSFDKVLSFNGVFNFIVGDRGVGKTYGAKKKAIKDALKHGHEFIYLRRFKDDIRTRATFFADVMHEFPDNDFRVNGMIGETAPVETRDDKKRPWKLICYFATLSQAASMKSQPFPEVRTIIYDEFILEKGMRHYLPDEYHAFLEFFNTVDRSQDKTRVLFLANAISINNPYFLELKIRPDESSEFVTRSYGTAKNFVVCHFLNAADFRSEVYATKFGQFITGSDYAKYAVESEFSDATDNQVDGKPSTARYHFTLETRQGTFSVWFDGIGSNSWYMQEKRPKQEQILTLIPHHVDGQRTLVTPRDKLLGYLRTAFRQGRVYFDHAQTRNSFIEIFKD